MTSQTIAGPRLLASIDDYLGPGESRFFGAGFRRVSHLLQDARISSGPDGGRASVQARAGIRYPREWSTKGVTAQRPHLSTIDTLMLSEQLCRVLLGAPDGTPAGRAITLRRAELWAGNKPQEDDLTEFDVLGERLSSRPMPEQPDRVRSKFDCTTGALRTRLEIEHPASWIGPEEPGVRESEVPESEVRESEVREPEPQEFEAVRSTLELPPVEGRQWITDLVLHSPSEHVTGQVRIHPQPHQLSMLDCLVAGVQLGQVLLYEIDGVARADSNTLWMRHTELELAESPAQVAPGAAVAAVVTRLENSQVLHVHDQPWRVADIVTDLGPFSMRCSVAHLLPETE